MMIGNMMDEESDRRSMWREAGGDLQEHNIDAFRVGAVGKVNEAELRLPYNPGVVFFFVD
jgi:hypothetical protein